MNSIIDAIAEITTKIIKKSNSVAISNPTNDLGLPASGYKELRDPASLLAVAIDKYHTPISSDAKRAGESLFTIDSPIGDRVSSPVVWMKYSPVSQSILTLVFGATSFTPIAISRYPKESRNKPIACLVGDAGSMFRCPSLIHKVENRGANKTTKIALND